MILNSDSKLKSIVSPDVVDHVKSLEQGFENLINPNFILLKKHLAHCGNNANVSAKLVMYKQIWTGPLFLFSPFSHLLVVFK